MSIATPIHDASLSIEELAEDIRQELQDKYAFYRMLHATDRVLWWLEELNLRGASALPEGTYARVRQALRMLPSAALEQVRDTEHVQEMLDSVFDAQEVLFRLHDPQRDVAGDAAEAEPVDAEIKHRPPLDPAELAQRREAFRRATLKRLAGQSTGMARSATAPACTCRPPSR